ncbi:hypothetical protein LUZ60_009583 [Juncus effusus]|nr:hypothetical protein LUZ60_009583 [Juncus effusus]
MGKSGDSKKNRENEVIKYEGGKNQPILLNMGIAIVFSIAGFMLSQIKSKAKPQSIKPSLEIGEDEDESNGVVTQDQSEFKNAKASSSNITTNCTISNSATSALVSLSPTSKSSGDEEGFLLPEFNDLILEEFQSNESDLNPNSNSNPIQIQLNNQMDKEISFLKNLVCSLEEREKSLELQLGKFPGLKEHEISIRELQNQLKVQNVETKFYAIKIESLLSDNHNLKAQLSDFDRILKELEEKREEIRVLKEMERMRSTGEDGRREEMERMKEELIDLRRVVAKLEEEKSELVRQLDLELVRIDSNSIHTSKEAEAVEESNWARQENETLKEQIEQMKIDRCTDLEELVYLKWINACLRYELRDYQIGTGTNKTLAKDLNMTLSPKSEQIAKQLILEYAYNSSPDESDLNWEYSSQDSFFKSENSESDKKKKLFGKLRKLILGKSNYKGETSFSDEIIIGERKSCDSNSSSCLTEDLMVQSQVDKIGRCRSDFGVSYRGKGVVPLEPGNRFPNLESGLDGNEIPEKTRLKKLADALRLSGGRNRGKMDNRRTVSFSFSS